MNASFATVLLVMAAAVPAWAAEDFTGTKELRLIQGDLGSPKAKTVVITDEAKIEKLLGAIKLEKKTPCACDHINHAVFVKDKGQITVSLCDHCFDVGKNTYVMPPAFYKLYTAFVQDASPATPAEKASRPGPGNEVLGFDISKVRPPKAEKGEPIARLFYDYIYPNDVEAASSKLTEDEARRLVGKIFGELRKRYMDHEKITATPEEIQQFVAAMHRSTPAGGEGSKETKEETQRSFEGIGELYVRGWKLDRALYKKYGGTVIFQQANPFEPVGAYRQFLEEMEAAKVFEVYDPDNRQKFWHYFVRQHPFQVRPKDIDFDKPWWMQKK